jgi:hypothetical protein
MPSRAGRARSDSDQRSWLAGWWTESPSRQAPNDADEVEFKITRTNAKTTIDGKWRYASHSAVRENWDLVWVDAEIPADIAVKSADAALFVQHP